MPTPTTDVGHTATLLPCPFCGSSTSVQSRGDVSWAQCRSNECRSEGSSRFSEAEAIAAWNRRAHHEKLVEAAREGWQPIETLGDAGGTAFLVWCPDRQNIYEVISPGSGEPLQHFGGRDGDLTERATHWRPLPAPPALTTEASK